MLPFYHSMLASEFRQFFLDSGHAHRTEFAGEERILSGCRDSSQHYNHEIRLSAITHLQLPNVAVESLPSLSLKQTPVPT